MIVSSAQTIIQQYTILAPVDWCICLERHSKPVKHLSLPLSTSMAPITADGKQRSSELEEASTGRRKVEGPTQLRNRGSLSDPNRRSVSGSVHEAGGHRTRSGSLPHVHG